MRSMNDYFDTYVKGMRWRIYLANVCSENHSGVQNVIMLKTVNYWNIFTNTLRLIKGYVKFSIYMYI